MHWSDICGVGQQYTHTAQIPKYTTHLYKHYSPNPTNQEDTALVILATKTNLSETQKTVLRKGLTFVPKPKHLDIQSLHQDIRKFMHKLKTIYEIKTTTKPKPKPETPRDPFKHQNEHYKPNPERLSDNGTLDTFFHRIRTEMLDETLYKQNKPDNLNRKERLALRELIENI